jgi:lipoprotein-anchoring transpeptidase ErfK/SrfK
MIGCSVSSSPRSQRASASAPRRGRAVLATLVVACALAATSSPAVAAARAIRVPRSQRLALLLTGHAVRARPRVGSRRVSSVAELRPITGERTALPLIGTSQGSDGIRWLHVMLPGRPDGSSGWIARRGTRELSTPWRLIVHLNARRVLVYRDGRLVKSFAAVVGKPSTPTPTGSYFVEETLQMDAAEPGGPFALALSARSNALQEFEGGPGQIALHGRDGLGGALGAAESHGCMRLATASIDWLAERIGPGVPVQIDQV